MVLYRVSVWSGLLACHYKFLSPLVATQSINQFTTESTGTESKGNKKKENILTKTVSLTVCYEKVLISLFYIRSFVNKFESSKCKEYLPGYESLNFILYMTYKS